MGGITPWLKVAHLAEAFNVSVAPHFLMELHVSLATAVPNGRWLEWIPQLSTVAPNGPAVTAGRAPAPADAGLGIGWDLAALAAHQVDDDAVEGAPWEDEVMGTAAQTASPRLGEGVRP
ncbi:enolase C-terminal domain-like protein [Streptomyces sp. CA-106131]|uniref:enolase C-terminal domain-like protein n=1 Tax=Streptomyces sp. CA-106131 TaxID=3240045 RepID=UPI003D926579